MYQKKCLTCCKEFQSPWKETKYCNRSCYANSTMVKGVGTRLGKSRKGTHPKRVLTQKRPGFHINQDGYKMILIKNHPYTKKYIMEHRFIMENHLGRYLVPGEVVHHKNHSRTDNRLDNLELLNSHSDHILNHHSERDKKGRFA